MYRRYQIRITCERSGAVDSVLGICSQSKLDTVWVTEVSESEIDPPFDYVNEFLGVLDGKYEALDAIGVKRGDIEIWVLYEFRNECNFELSSTNMEKLGRNGLSFCLSCWQE